MILIAAVVALAAAGFAVVNAVNEGGDLRQPNEDLRAPVANPPVEPDRPDLYEEPRIDDEPGW